MKLSIETGNAAFEDDNKFYEVARILRQAADKVEYGDTEFNLRDINGNHVGNLTFEEKVPFTELAAVVLQIETGNAAFEDDSLGLESARIMREAAYKIIDTQSLDFTLRDYNGNAVGHIKETVPVVVAVPAMKKSLQAKSASDTSFEP